MRLSDCFSDVIAYVSYVLTSRDVEQVDYDQFRQKVQALMAESEQDAAKGAFAPDHYDVARFAICAWIDETILSSSWSARLKWQKEQLQRQYYHTTDAGIEFYERLNGLGLHQSEVREIYYMCLAMGFRGRYCNDQDNLLINQMKDANLKILLGSSVGLPNLERMEFFPEAYPANSESLNDRNKKGFLTGGSLFFVIAPVALLVILFVVYHFILGNIVDLYLAQTK